MIKILYDHQTFSEQRFGGISRYFSSLINGIKENNYFNAGLGLLYSKNYYIRKHNTLLKNSFGDFIFKKPKTIYRWNKQYCKYLMRLNNYDVLHPTNFHPYFTKYNKKPSVITVHDMINERLPEYFINYDMLPVHKTIAVNYATAVIAVSENTKQDLINILGIPADKISVIHHGIDLKSPLKPKGLTVPENFILYVGGRHTYKNFFRFSACCAELIKSYPGLHIVFAGGGPFQFAETACITRLGIENRCTQFDVTDAELNYLYQKAQVFVFPSLYEGFGIPILESFKSKCPIAASNTSCFPEIGGDAIAYFDPYDEKNMFQVISDLLTNQNKAYELIMAGLNRIKLFPIENQVDKTLKLYKKVSGVEA